MYKIKYLITLALVCFVIGGILFYRSGSSEGAPNGSSSLVSTEISDLNLGKTSRQAVSSDVSGEKKITYAPEFSPSLKTKDAEQGLATVQGQWGASQKESETIHWLPSGHSEMKYLKPQEKIKIHLDYGIEGAGREVVLQAEDGGAVSGVTVLKKIVESDGSLDFEFQTTENIGIYRVTARGGGSSKKTFQFWVGSTPPLKKSS